MYPYNTYEFMYKPLDYSDLVWLTVTVHIYLKKKIIYLRTIKLYYFIQTILF